MDERRVERVGEHRLGAVVPTLRHVGPTVPPAEVRAIGLVAVGLHAPHVESQVGLRTAVGAPVVRNALSTRERVLGPSEARPVEGIGQVEGLAGHVFKRPGDLVKMGSLDVAATPGRVLAGGVDASARPRSSRRRRAASGTACGSSLRTSLAVQGFDLLEGVGRLAAQAPFPRSEHLVVRMRAQTRMHAASSPAPFSRRMSALTRSRSRHTVHKPLDMLDRAPNTVRFSIQIDNSHKRCLSGICHGRHLPLATVQEVAVV